MSQDRNEPNSRRQVPNLHWEEPPKVEMLPLSYEQDEAEEINSDQMFVGPGESSETGNLQGSNAGFERLKDIGHQLSPIITPLLFGGITFLFLLALMRSHQFYLYADRLWSIGLVLIAAMVLQGMMLYYAGDNNTYWTLSIVGGFCLFLLVGCFALFGPFTTLILLVLLLIIGIIAARFATHTVPEGSVEIVYANGKYSRTLSPGLHFMLPWEKTAAHLPTKERTWTCPEQTVPISRDEDVHLKAMISYQLMPDDAHLAVIQIENWEESLRELFKAVLQSVVTHLTPDDFRAWSSSSGLLPSSGGGVKLSNPEMVEAANWSHINLLLEQQMQDRVALWGVQINWVHIRDITLTPGAATLIITDPNINLAAVAASAASSAPTPPVQNVVAQASTLPTAGRATTPPVMGRVSTPPVVGNQAPKPPVEAVLSPPIPGAKLPSEETLKSAYKQIQSGGITSPDTIRRIAAGFQAIANDPEASKNATFDAGRAAQALFEQAKLIEDRANVAPPLSVSGAQRNDTPTSSGWSIRTPSDNV